AQTINIQKPIKAATESARPGDTSGLDFDRATRRANITYLIPSLPSVVRTPSVLSDSLTSLSSRRCFGFARVYWFGFFKLVFGVESRDLSGSRWLQSEATCGRFEFVRCGGALFFERESLVLFD